MSKFRIIICIIFQLLYNIFTIFFAWIIMKITDCLVIGDSTSFVSYLAYAGIGICLQILFNYLSLHAQNGIVNTSMTTTRELTLLGILKNQSRFLTTEEKSQYLSFFTNELELFECSYLRNILNIVNGILLLILSGGMIFYIHKYLLITIVIMMVFTSIIPVVFSGILQKLNDDYLISNKQMIHRTNDFLSGYEIIKSFAVEQRIVQLYKIVIKKNIECKNKLENTMCLSNVISGLLATATILSTFIVGGYLILDSVITIGALLASIQLISNMISPLTEILCAFSELLSVKSVKDKIADLLRKATVPQCFDTIESLGNTLEVKDLSFKYPEEDFETLQNINLILQRGKTYAIVGENGSGKSTFAKIIAGYYTNYSGSIKFDDVDLKQISSNAINSRVTYVNQNNYLFDATPKDNYTLFSSFDVNKSLVRNLGCDELITNECIASSLSGGECQKISFLRALNKDSDILICDESESAMDILSKKRYLDILNADKSKIIISITHTIDNSLRNYDEILYFKDGRLLEQGALDELHSNKKDFYKFYYNKIA